MIMGISNSLCAHLLAVVLTVSFVLSGPCETCKAELENALALHQEVSQGLHDDAEEHDDSHSVSMADMAVQGDEDSQRCTACDENATQPKIITISGKHDPYLWISDRQRPRSLTYEPAVVPV